MGFLEFTRQHAKWYNSLQKLAEQSRLGIPVTISTGNDRLPDFEPVYALLGLFKRPRKGI